MSESRDASGDGTNEFFFALSPERVLEAVEACGLPTTGHCFALNALENRVYDVRLESGEHAVAKFYRPGRWSREAILEEHAMLFALRDAEIPVCAPRVDEGGGSLHEILGIYYAVWPRTGGRSPDELSDDQVAVLGRLLARIHATGESLHFEHRRRLTSDHLAREPLELIEERGFLPPFCADRYADAVERVAEIYDERSEGIAEHPIHGDCHVGNLLHGDQGWFFLDFDDMVIGPAVQDVWMLLPGRDAEAARQRAILVDAYRQFRAFDEAEWTLVEPLRALRFVFYAGWIAKRWEDPAFPDAFPHFGSDDYWENETRDLEEQIDRIEGGNVTAGGAIDDEFTRPDDGPDGELTNKDFFWDL